MKSILITGSNGLLGQEVTASLLKEGYYVTGVSIEKTGIFQHNRFEYISTDLTRSNEVERIFKNYEFSHVIHLAAIAHVFKGQEVTWPRYYRVNTMLSRQVFKCASAAKIPIFFSSTVDVYGITNEVINEKSKPNPIGFYGRSKYLAEKSLMEFANQPYLIARFAPIYTWNNHRDIQKRFYIHYPKVCYQIGKGLEYEFLSVERAVNLITDWCKEPNNYPNLVNLFEDKSFNTKTLIKEEQKENKGKRVIYIPQWIANFMTVCVKRCFRRKPFLIFKVSKILKPIRLARD